MVKTPDANQIPKIERPHIQPIYFIHLLLEDLTLYLSDRNYLYNSQNYEDYLIDLSNIENEIRNSGGFENCQITFNFKNDKIRDKNYLIEFFDDYPPEKRYLEIYKLLINTGESFGSDVSSKIFKGEMGQHYDITETGFKIDCSTMLFGKNHKLPLDVIDLLDFPYADPDDVGKYRNILYGNLKKVYCPWTVAGWASTLAVNMDTVETTITVSDDTGIPALPFTCFVDLEEVRVTANTPARTFTVTRGYNSTTAVTHNKGSIIYEKRSDFEAEVAQHPVKSIGDVFVKRGSDEWLRVIDGFTKYINSSGRAKIVFTDRPKFEQKIIFEKEIDEGSHIHDAGGSTNPAGYLFKKCLPTGASGGTNPSYAIDGNDESYVGLSDAPETLTVTFTEVDQGTINRQIVWVRNNGTAVSGSVSCGGVSLGTLSAVTGWHRFIKSSNNSWGDNVTVQAGAYGNAIGEVYKEVEYAPIMDVDVNVNTHPATAIDVILSGNSAANMVIGDCVVCDVEGYEDDGSGTYTGTPNALIERPDHVRHHILVALLEFSASDIDLAVSFDSVGTIYDERIPLGYKLAFVLHEVATEAMELFGNIDFETRSSMFESEGLFKLGFHRVAGLTSDKTFDFDNIKGLFKFSKTEIADIKNKIRFHYSRDYSKSGAIGDKYPKIKELFSALSIVQYGTITEDIEFKCIGNYEAMINDVGTWILYQKQNIKKIVEFEAFWDAMILESCDIFDVVSNFWSGNLFKVLKMVERPETQLIEMKGIESNNYEYDEGFEISLDRNPNWTIYEYEGGEVDDHYATSEIESPEGWDNYCVKIHCPPDPSYPDPPLEMSLASIKYKAPCECFKFTWRFEFIIIESDMVNGEYFVLGGTYGHEVIGGGGYLFWSHYFEIFKSGDDLKLWHEVLTSNEDTEGIASDPLSLNTKYKVEINWDNIAKTWNIKLDDVELDSGTLDEELASESVSHFELGAGGTSNYDKTNTICIDNFYLALDL